MPKPTDPKLIPLYEAAKKMHIAKLLKEKAAKEAASMNALAEAHRTHKGQSAK
ncbi:MAG: hypothetical protein U0791_18485 [Gemmataceae bacterium]